MKSNIFILSGPSGAGEDSVIKGLKNKINFEKIITSTTREIRPREIDGKDYYFLTKEEFKKGIKNNEFFEHAEEDNGNFYGCTFKEIERVKKIKKPVIWKIDYQGMLTAKKIVPEAISILVYAPINILEKRIRHRGHTDENFIKGRLEHAKGWFKNKDKFDFIIENKDGKLDDTIEKVLNIINNNYK